MSKIVAIACDHAGVALKEALKTELVALGCSPLDLGTNGAESVDYPDFANLLAAAMKQDAVTTGILICGSGIGISIAANRHPHIRAALCYNTVIASLSRQHNDANVLVLGARMTSLEEAKDILRTFLSTNFEGGRHAHRVSKLSD